jgi:hypothetical protein
VTQPLVSVVMIFKDARAYLAEAARSVLAQSYEPLELVLVDDGGTDGSDVVAAEVAASASSRVRVLTHPGRVNRGTGASRALGIRGARGELVAFLDADDRWDPGHVAHEVELLTAHPAAGMVCGRTWLWWSWDGAGPQDRLSPLAFAPGVVVDPPRLLAAVLRHGDLATPTCSLLVRTAAARACAGALEEFPRMYEDQVLNSLLQLRVPAVMSGAVSAWYRQHPQSTSALAVRDGSDHPVQANDSRRRFLTWLDGLPELQRERADPELRAQLDRALEQQVVPRPSPVRRTVDAVLPPAARRLLRPPLRQAVGRLSRRRGAVRLRLASLAFVEPVSRQFGYDRGLPVDRSYVEGFLDSWAEDVRGRVLEVGDDSYTRRFGGSRVCRADVLNVHDGFPGTTFVADLADGAGLPDSAFDCVVLTQTLHLVFDVHAAARTLHRILRPGGVLLLTVPGISPVSTDEWASTWHWSFTQHSARRLFEEVFGRHLVEVWQYGNALAATAFLQGLSTAELSPRALSTPDEQYPVIIAVRAVRPAAAVGGGGTPPAGPL